MQVHARPVLTDDEKRFSDYSRRPEQSVPIGSIVLSATYPDNESSDPVYLSPNESQATLVELINAQYAAVKARFDKLFHERGKVNASLNDRAQKAEQSARRFKHDFEVSQGELGKLKEELYQASVHAPDTTATNATSELRADADNLRAHNTSLLTRIASIQSNTQAHFEDVTKNIQETNSRVISELRTERDQLRFYNIELHKQVTEQGQTVRAERAVLYHLKEQLRQSQQCVTAAVEDATKEMRETNSKLAEAMKGVIGERDAARALLSTERDKFTSTLRERDLQWPGLRAEINQLRDQREEARKEVEELKAAREQLQVMNSNQRGTLGECNRHIATQATQLGDAESTIAKLKEQMETERNKFTSTLRERWEVLSPIAVERKLRLLRGLVVDLKSERDGLKESLAELKEKACDAVSGLDPVRGCFKFLCAKADCEECARRSHATDTLNALAEAVK